MKEFRVDRGELQIPTKTQQGFLLVDGYATRAGIFEYFFTDGSIRRELRPVEEVFKADSLQSLAHVAITNDHPPEMVNPSNVSRYSVGMTGGRADVNGIFVKIPLVIQEAQAIDDVESRRKQELSCGYLCDIEFTPGEYQGMPYDAIQRNIIYNHLAIVTDGRAGPEARIKMDSSLGEMEKTIKEVRQVKTDSQGEPKMAKITINRVEYEATDALAKVVSEKLDALDSSSESLETLKGEKDELAGKLAGQEAQLQAKDKEIEALKKAQHDKKDCMVVAKDRFALEQKALAILGDEFVCDGLSDLDVKKKIAEKARPDMKLDSLSEAFIDGLISGLSFEKSDGSDDRQDNKELNKMAGILIDNKKEDKAPNYDIARQKYIEDSRNAWKQDAAK